ncbi:tetratricopeptide repeat protein [Microbulbifer sp. GL-2]|uniref:tetratricopeptide repeat protein n=1 Tax=unclassified Microbulbifer TaxID=2619833 RepID=UPI0011645508|nr:tetratricopeptide repeat protein [Microbulbifer sp. GL-2]BBM02434.1 hypothetical protein GL2_25080 [Microbulbifer sp. GL-2]
MNIVEKYQYYSENNEWEKALPVIREIIDRSPKIPTSWFNYGITLENLGKHSEAVQAFFNAYQLQPDDYRAQYRIFRNLALAKDTDRFVKFVSIEAKKTPGIIDMIAGIDDFKEMRATDQYKEFLRSNEH